MSYVRRPAPLLSQRRLCNSSLSTLNFLWGVCKCCKSCLQLCTHVSSFMLNYLLQPVTYSWLSFPPRCSTFSESTSLPSSSALSVHTHSLQFLAAPLEHEIMPLAFIGGRRPVGVFVAVPARDLFFQCRSASPVPTGLALGALACRLSSFHPARVLVT